MGRHIGVQELALCILLAALIAPTAWPQASTGTVSGTVRDQTGAVIPGAAVTLTHTGTNGVSRTTANPTGFYMFPGVIPGRYLIVVEVSGMQKLLRPENLWVSGGLRGPIRAVRSDS